MTFLLYLATAVTLLLLSHRGLRAITLAAALALLLMPLCLTGRALLTGAVFGPIDLIYITEPLQDVREANGVGHTYNAALSDIASQMIPYRKAVRDAIASGAWPLWNRYTLCGEVLAASAQPAPYSPFTLIALLMPVAVSFTFTAAITFFVAGLSAFLFVREVGCREVVALIAGAGWMYSSAISFFVLWPLGASWALLPLVLLAVRRVTDVPGVASGALLLVALTLVTLSGHPETLVHVVFTGVVYGIAEMAVKRARAERATATALLGGATTLLLCAVYLLPILDAAPQTIDHDFRKNVFARSNPGLPPPAVLATLATDLLPFLHFRQWRIPDVQTTSFESAAVGSVIVAAALYAIIRVRSREKWLFTVLLFFSLMAGARWMPLAKLLQKLPLFDIALNHRFSFAAAFFFVVLAAFGFERIAQHDDLRAAGITFALVLLVITVASLYALPLVRESAYPFGDFRLGAEIAFLGVAALLVALRTPNAILLPALLGVVLLQRTIEEHGVYPVFPAATAYPRVPIFEPLAKVKEPFRVTGYGLTFIPGMSAMYDLEDARGYSAMKLGRLVDTYHLWSNWQPVWFNRVDDLSRPFLSFLNVRYAVTWPLAQVPAGWREVARQRGTMLLENTRVLPRAFVPRNVSVGYRVPDATVVEMESVTDFRERAWIRADVPLHDRPNGPGEVMNIRRTKYGFEFDVVMARDGWVVVSQPGWRGWRAYIDDRRVQHQAANHAFIGIYVPPGRHAVRLVFWPRSFVAGRAISLATAASIVVFPVVRRWRRGASRRMRLQSDRSQ